MTPVPNLVEEATPMAPITAACEASSRLRSSRSQYRAQVARGELSLRDLLTRDDIPPSVGTVRAFQVVTWPFHSSCASARHSPVRLWLQRLNFAALHNAVNVFEEVGRLNATQREWLVAYVEQHPAGQPSRRRRHIA